MCVMCLLKHTPDTQEKVNFLKKKKKEGKCVWKRKTATLLTY